MFLLSDGCKYSETDFMETGLTAANVEQKKKRMSSVPKMIADTSHVATLLSASGSIKQDDGQGQNIILAFDI